ncbi:MAG: GGDEF domain-containing protein [Lachnospiraceae bacterium]|nr:GGDEF domain-containing protein [Lachnospiraceae bacterium]
MRIDRYSQKDSNIRRIDTALYDCVLFVRSDFTVSSASKNYYEFVGENSVLAFTDLIDEEDAKLLKDFVVRGMGSENCIELYTRLTNKLDEGWRNVYLRLDKTDHTEEKAPLYRITLIDVLNAEVRMEQLDKKANKYRFYMSIKDEYYFEYDPESNIYKYYKYVNGKAIDVYSGDLDEFCKEQVAKSGGADYMTAQTEKLAKYLKGRNTSFEMRWRSHESGDEGHAGLYQFRGGVSIYNPEIVTGVISSEGSSDDMAYYLTTAGKDSFTGLLNKKASTEYSVEKINSAGKNILWMIVIDIDDFKSINDNYGHAFGDVIIRFVAENLQKHMGRHGIVGRFGGDEFYALMHDVPTREELKLILKVISKELMYAFDDKVKLTMSVGVSQYPKDGTQFDELFGKADKALYIAKEKGKNRHIIYDEKLHGEYSQESIKYQTVSYMVSREKRRGMLVRCISDIQENGIDSFLKNRNLQQGLLDLFDLGGITIYGDYGKKVILRSGDYPAPPEDRAGIAYDENYAAQYEHETTLVISTVNRLKPVSTLAYESAVNQEIGASVRCGIKKGDEIYIFVDFDVFNTNRKWSDSDIDILTILGCTIGEMIKLAE